MDAMRFNARYKMGDMMLSGMYQMAEPTKKGAARYNRPRRLFCYQWFLQNGHDDAIRG
jgi:hypothetical protein